MQPGEAARADQGRRSRRATYRIVCTIANHDDLGQYGKLIDRGPAAVSAAASELQHAYFATRSGSSPPA